MVVLMPAWMHSCITDQIFSSPAANVIFCVPGHFVGHDDVADAQAGFGGMGEQLVAGAERVTHRRLVGDHDGVVVVGDLCVVEDEAPADGVEGALRHHRTAVIEGPKHHGVGVKSGLLVAMQDDVVGQAECDRMLAEQRQLSGVGDGRDPVGRAVGVDRVGPLPHQAEGDGRDAAVALAGRAEGAEQFDGDPTRVESSVPSCARPRTNRSAAIIGPTVCELDGPMPILNRSKTLRAMVRVVSWCWLDHRSASATPISDKADHRH